MASRFDQCANLSVDSTIGNNTSWWFNFPVANECASSRSTIVAKEFDRGQMLHDSLRCNIVL